MTSEKTATTPRFNYTGYGTQGDRYTPNMTVKEIAVLIRNELKEKFPKIKFSITSAYNALRIYMMAAEFNPFTPVMDLDTEQQRGHKEYVVSHGYTTVNQHYIKSATDITDEAKEVMAIVSKIADSYNFDDSDGMIDYFHTNFYLTLGIGRWDKAFSNTCK